jgi:cysteine desulfurase
VIDLDQQATTPLAPEARAAMLEWLGERDANPHSAHRAGRAAKAAIEAARAEVAAVLGVAAGTILFTSGATEANNLALKGLFGAGAGAGVGGALITFGTEHSCILETARALAKGGVPVRILPVLPDGMPDMEAYARALKAERVALVSAMRVNNEIGSIWPIAAMAEAAHAVGARFHCDAAQAFGKVPCDLAGDLGGADMVSLSAHKIHGPKGVGALMVAEDLTLEPLFHGGGQERFRSGTQSPALVAGFGAAARLARGRMDEDRDHARHLSAIALDTLAEGGVAFAVNGPPPLSGARIATNLSLRFPGAPAARLLPKLRDVVLSSGAACSSGAGRPSHVLAALGLARDAVGETVRVGFGRYTSEEEVERAFQRLAVEVAALQKGAR